MALQVKLGRIVATPAALEALESARTSPLALLARHSRGDWGDLDSVDRRANDYDATHDGRVLSAYNLASGQRVWVITEWDRSVTTILLPEEY